MRTVLLVGVFCAAIPYALAQRSKSPLDDATHRSAGLDQIVENLARQTADKRPSARKKALLIWLVDNTTEMANSGQHEALATAIQRHFTAGSKYIAQADAIEHSIILIDASLQMLLRPTNDVAAVLDTLRTIARKPQSAIRDTMGAISACTQHFARSSHHKAIVLFTIENGDTESMLEETALWLRRTRTALYVVCREGVFSDPYWLRRSYDAEKHKPLELVGHEAPYVEYPWGWLFMIRDPHESAPAGFGMFGLNRLVVESGGSYFLYDPAVPPPSSSRCSVIYQPFRLKQYEPPTSSRAGYAALVERSRAWLTIRECWLAAYKMGVVYSLPPELAAGGTVEVSRSSTTRGVSRRYYSWSIDNLAKAAEQAAKDRVEIDGLLARLAAHKLSTRDEAFDRRAVAIADNLRFSLMVTRFNLLQLMHVAAYVQQVRGGAALSEIEDPHVRAGATDIGLSYSNRVFCETGIRAMEETAWLGGAVARAEMKALTAELIELKARHSGTPFEVVLERNAVVVFRVIEYVRGNPTEIQRLRESSSTEKPEVTTPTRPERSRSSGSASGSGTTTR
jgi:hypothetical protein